MAWAIDRLGSDATTQVRLTPTKLLEILQRRTVLSRARRCREQAQQCARGLAGLLDHVVGSREQRGWHCDAESLRGL